MKRLEIADATQIILALDDEIRRNKDARYNHRLHAVLLVARGLTCGEVSDLLGDSVRAVQYWVNRFEGRGFASLADSPRPGRTPKLTNEQMDIVLKAIHGTPEEYGLSGYLWDGKTLAAFIKQEFDVILSVRQCQRIFRRFGFRYRKPRPMIAGTDIEVKEEFKKTQNSRK